MITQLSNNCGEEGGALLTSPVPALGEILAGWKVFWDLKQGKCQARIQAP